MKTSILRGFRFIVLSGVFFAAAASTAGNFNIIGGEGSSVRNLAGRSVLTFLQDGTFTVSGPGTVEILMVGGGGGGGVDLIRDGKNQGAAGGGGGGVVHKESFVLQPGTYTVSVGVGGDVCSTKENAAQAMGDNTVLSRDGISLLTAFGGGYGAFGGNVGGDGGCGGGGAKSYWDLNSTSEATTKAGGKAIYSGEGNLGFDGGVSTHSYGPGGGGGAGGPAEGGRTSSGEYRPALPGSGGIGYACSITGEEVYYAGGGGGWNRDNVGAGGLGGGGAGHVAGTDGLGGGGGANAKGGSGVLIISFVPRGTTKDFKIAGSGKMKYVGGDSLMTFTESGTFSVEGAGVIEILMVGGGGGGGVDLIRDGKNQGAAGGGGGGVVHKESFALHPGTYTVSVGVGGDVWSTKENAAQAMGGNTVLSNDGISLLMAFGGGYGAFGGNVGGDGGCGGGGAKSYWDLNSTSEATTKAGGKAIYSGQGNLGFDGGVSTHSYGPGGGGGAGGPAEGGRTSSGEYRPALPGSGGIGYACSITGEEVYYAGGGGGWNRDNVGAGGLGGGGAGHVAGTDGLGGGGGANAKGGSGVLIIRYKRWPKGVVLSIK